jgi:chemotaxis signal transduction protein
MQVVAFTLCKHRAAFRVEKVREVIRCASVAAVFRSPPFLQGLLHVRGDAVPVLDLGILLGMGECTADGSYVVVVESGVLVVGFLAEGPVDICDAGESTSHVPAGERGRAMDAVESVLLMDAAPVLLLDADKVLALPDVRRLRQQRSDVP